MASRPDRRRELPARPHPGGTRPGRAPRTRSRPAGGRLARGRLPRAGLRAAEPDGSGDRFGLLLLVLIATYIVSSFVTGSWVSALQVVLFVVVAALAARSGRIPRGTARLLILILAAGSVAAVVLVLTHPADVWAGVANLWTALVLLVAVVLIVRRVLSHAVITLQSIFGAVAAYMILGLMFAAIYAAIDRLSGGGFFAAGEPESVKTFQYFSFTTLTTLGYGDFTAAASGGQAVAVMEALFGQVFLATLVARLVASFRPGARRDASAGGRRGGPQPPRPPPGQGHQRYRGRRPRPGRRR